MASVSQPCSAASQSSGILPYVSEDWALSEFRVLTEAAFGRVLMLMGTVQLCLVDLQFAQHDFFLTFLELSKWLEWFHLCLHGVDVEDPSPLLLALRKPGAWQAKALGRQGALQDLCAGQASARSLSVPGLCLGVLCLTLCWLQEKHSPPGLPTAL